MVNYKQQFKDSFNINGYVHFLKETDEIKYLKTPLAAATESLDDRVTSAEYIVPAGKTLKIFYITALATNVSTDKLIFGETINSADSSTVLLQPTASINTFLWISQKIPAANYITKVDTTTSHNYEVIAIEEDV